MLAELTEIQPLFLGLVLAWAGGYKITGRTVDAAAARSALAGLVGARAATVAYRAVGGAELVVALLLLAPPAAGFEGWCGVALAGTFLAYLGYARKYAPKSSCGCMSADSRPVGWRSIARAALLLGAALAATRAGGYWAADLGVLPLGVFALEGALLLALSPDLDRPRRRLVGRLRELIWPHPLSVTEGTEVPLAAALAQLHGSEVYGIGGALVCSDVQDSWDAGDWYAISFAGRLGGRHSDGPPVTVVFAVPKRYAPDDIRMSILDEDGEPVVLSPTG